MNKSEKIICLILGAVLAWYIFNEASKKPKVDPATVVEQAQPAAPAAAPEKAAPVAEKPLAAEPATVLPTEPEETYVLENDLVRLEVTSWGAAVRKVTLKKYAQGVGEVGPDNPPVVLDYSKSPLGAEAPLKAFKAVKIGADAIELALGDRRRVLSLGKDYAIQIEDSGVGEGTISLGRMAMGNSKNDSLSVDSFAEDAGKGKPGVIHHSDDDSPLKPYLVGGLAGGCSGSKSAAGMPASESVAYPGVQRWVAIKNRFFVTALAKSSVALQGFEAEIARDVSAANYRPLDLGLKAKLAAGPAGEKRTLVFYAGPKQQSLLWDLGMKDVMEFGMWRWICYPLVWVLNLFHGWIPNFGIAIILLTILVRILFWPLTHKSTVGMKKMQELQPKMKAIQAQFKDNPQRLQQETWALYKSEKVNPMSSCLPMLVQIPVFIALFNVLRSAVELRYAPFLWIADLSEPEGLLAAYLPFGGLNLLPILMAVTTGLQSYFTPSSGDKNQQKMMMIFMPAMMLVMFYSFPSALSLYWFLSNLFSIVQMYLIRRATQKETAALAPEVVEAPVTRQMRRHG